MLLRRYWLIAVVICGTARAVTAPDPVKAGMDAARLRAIASRLQEMTDKGEIAGAVWHVQRHGVLADSGAIGYADLESRRPMRPDTIFAIHSLGKSFVATAIMQLVDAGKVALDDPIEKYMPEFAGLWLIESQDAQRRVLRRPSRQPTIRDLLGHTAGMDVEGRHAPPALRNELFVRETRAEYVTIVSQQPLGYDPGSKAMYDSAGYFVLDQVIEAVTGKTVEDVLQEHIFRSLGMKDTCYTCAHWTAELRAKMAASYSLQGGELVRNRLDFGSTVFPITGLSTAGDLASFYQSILGHGAAGGERILSASAIREMTRVQRPDLQVYPAASPWSGYRFGLGWWVVYSPEKGLAGFAPGAFSGQGAGGSEAWIDPQKDLMWVLLLQGGDGEKARTIVREIVLGAVK